MDKVKCIIFDFDGTLADTFDMIFKIAKRVSDESDLEMLGEDETRSMSAREILDKYNISKIESIRLLKKYRRDLGKYIDDIRMFSGLAEVLRKLDEKFVLGILTSNSEDNVKRFLENNDMKDVFDFIESRNPLFGKHRRLKRIMKKYGYEKNEIVYIGDEVRDIIAANKVGISTISVAWGCNSKERLEIENPDFIINKPSELLKILKPV